MPVRDTSTAALADNAPVLKTLADRVAGHLADHGRICTRAEIAAHFKAATATISGVVNRLIAQGRVVEEPGKYVCEVTGNQVHGVSIA